jgi:hypothetical protein
MAYAYVRAFVRVCVHVSGSPSLCVCVHVVRACLCARACARVRALQATAAAFVGSPSPVHRTRHRTAAAATPAHAGVLEPVRRSPPLRAHRSARTAAQMVAGGGSEDVVSPFAADEVGTKVGGKEIAFTVEGVDTVLDSVRPYLIAGTVLPLLPRLPGWARSPAPRRVCRAGTQRHAC